MPPIGEQGGGAFKPYTNIVERFGGVNKRWLRAWEGTPGGAKLIWPAGPTRFFALNNGSNSIRVLDGAGNRVASEDIALGGGNWEGISASADRLYTFNNTGAPRHIRVWGFDGTRYAAEDINIHALINLPRGLSVSSNRIYVGGSQNGRVRVIGLDGTRYATEDILFPAQNWGVVVRRPENRIHTLGQSPNKIFTLDLSGTRYMSEEIVLPTAGIYEGLTSSTSRFYVIHDPDSDGPNNYIRVYGIDGTRYASEDIPIPKPSGANEVDGLTLIPRSL